MALTLKKDLMLYNLMEVYYIYKKYKRLKKTKVRTKEIHAYERSERETHGFFQQACQMIKNRDDIEFRKITQMNISSFEILTNLLDKRLEKTSRGRSIEPDCCVMLTLMYLCQGTKWRTLSKNFQLGFTIVRNIVMETCEAIWDELHCIFLSPPNENKWREIANGFYNKTGLPHCVGCIDGKQIRIRCSPRSGPLKSNSKKCYNVVLLAACDYNYFFTAVDIGVYDSQDEDTILPASSFGSQILDNKINLPENDLVGSNLTLPYFFVGDAVLPLRNNLMKPYSDQYLTEDKAHLNKVFSKVKDTIENSFGVMTMRWRVLCDGILLTPDNAEKVVKAVVVLHNFVNLNDSEYCPTTIVDHYDGEVKVNGKWRTEVKPLPQTMLYTRFDSSEKAFQIRDSLNNYINRLE